MSKKFDKCEQEQAHKDEIINAQKRNVSDLTNQIESFKNEYWLVIAILEREFSELLNADEGRTDKIAIWNN